MALLKPPQPLALFATVGFLKKITKNHWVRNYRRCFIWNPNKIVPLPPPKLDSDRK